MVEVSYVIALPLRNDAVDLRGEHAGNRRGQRLVVVVDLRANAVNSRRRRTADEIGRASCRERV